MQAHSNHGSSLWLHRHQWALERRLPDVLGKSVLLALFQPPPAHSVAHAGCLLGSGACLSALLTSLHKGSLSSATRDCLGCSCPRDAETSILHWGQLPPLKGKAWVTCYHMVPPSMMGSPLNVHHYCGRVLHQFTSLSGCGLPTSTPFLHQRCKV